MVPVLGSPGDDKADGTPTVVPSSPSVSAPESSPASSASSKQTDTHEPDDSPSPAGSELWRGSLLLDHEPKDLDTGQPVAVGFADEGDVYTLPGNEIEGWNGTVISLWSGRTTRLPSYEECTNMVDAEGTRKQQLTKNGVLCVRTSAGNIARLKLTALGSDGIGSDNRNMFDAVVWDAS
ncbi:hypothetical protein [Streptomyces halstedii]|uniref:Uncharacterized protein n=1 Tax=Streptomyces halstedii TaxID=1944 RepID=A0A6N9U4F9_STRHA|nr:hypothetical protein [Streptomyces halstedii]NEA16903.1 hypothetical protein [Streptomyces halstedii]